MAIGKTKRFEIFKRDGFTCQYCGNRPPDVILEVDHIHPVAGGGLDDDINLITACFDCNRGKRDRRLENVGPKPDADLEYLKIQQEIVETKRYLKAKSQRDKAMASLIESLNSTWIDFLTQEYTPNDRQWRTWLAKYSPDEVESAIKISAKSFRAGRFGNNEGKAVGELIRFASGVMRNTREEKDEEEYANSLPPATPTEWNVINAFQASFTTLIKFYEGKDRPKEWEEIVVPFAKFIERLYADYKKRVDGEEIPF